MKREYKYLSYCGMYHCALCDYRRGTLVKATRNLLAFVEKYDSLRFIANACNAYNFSEFTEGLKWLASQDEPCRGCRFGDGWSWWSDCTVRGCCVEKNIDFCYQCKEFPCKTLMSEPMSDYKETIIEANNQIKIMGVEDGINLLKRKYT
ncbi:MAG: DUF3795 domain-containing protein [Promethearchaeota archaeon]